MKIKSITYGYKFNKGNYETEDISITTELDETEDAQKVFDEIKSLVKRLGQEKNPNQLEFPAETELIKAPTPKKRVKKEQTKSVKVTLYDRSSALHKKIVADIFSEILPNWRTECPDKAKKVSESLEGAALLDATGNVLESFKCEARARLTSS